VRGADGGKVKDSKQDHFGWLCVIQHDFLYAHTYVCTRAHGEIVKWKQIGKDPKLYVRNDLLVHQSVIQWRIPFYFACLFVCARSCLCGRTVEIRIIFIRLWNSYSLREESCEIHMLKTSGFHILGCLR